MTVAILCGDIVKLPNTRIYTRVSFMIYKRVCNKINTTGANSGTGTAYHSGAPEFNPGFNGVRVIRSLVLCVCFVDRCLSFVYFLWPFCCLSRLDLRILITPLISSSSSYVHEQLY